jgi:hypothetical protein
MFPNLALIISKTAAGSSRTGYGQDRIIRAIKIGIEKLAHHPGLHWQYADVFTYGRPSIRMFFIAKIRKHMPDQAHRVD